MNEYVATLIARPEHAADLAAVLALCADVADATRVDELATDEAMDVFFLASEELAVVRHRFTALAAGMPVDVVVQPAVERRKKLIVADMDSTIIGQESLDELADIAEVRTKVAAITERAMLGEVEFEPALRERVALLAGLPADAVDRVIGERIRLNPGARTLVWTMRANGAHAMLVSGGFSAVAEKVAAMAGFNESRANRLLISDGKLTGKVAEPIVGRTAKLAVLEDAIIRLRLTHSQTLAVGDGASDLAMIAHAGLGVAYHAKPKVAAAAAARIDHGDLTALLYAQGFRRSEFVT
jgi:phosphoserine phosphatase